jgi:hypothetical protein
MPVILCALKEVSLQEAALLQDAVNCAQYPGEVTICPSGYAKCGSPSVSDALAIIID